MNVAFVVVIIVVSSGLFSYGQEKPKSVVLPESAVQRLTQPCSRPGPPKFEETWLPAQNDVRQVEAMLSQISRLRSDSGIEGKQISEPEEYYRQHVGVVVEGRKLIYVNAICEEHPPEHWQDTVQDVCDGGCNWEVVYDTVTEKFSDLEMNGVGY